MKRNDVHRVSVVEPLDYDYLFSFSYPGACEPGINMALLRAAKTGEPTPGHPLYDGSPLVTHPKLTFFRSGSGGCDICGTQFRHGEVWMHRASRTAIVVGHNCAEKYSLTADRGEWQLKLKTVQAIGARRRNLFVWGRHNRDLLPLLRAKHRIVQSIRATIIEHPEWPLTDKQVELITKLASEPPTKHVPIPHADKARVAIEGTILSLKSHEGAYGTQTKMTVRVDTPDGSWMVWGTAPAGLMDSKDTTPLVGKKVQFTATILLGKRDPHFGFFKRPIGARIMP